MKMEIYTRRWEHTDHVTINKTDTGWRIGHFNTSYSGDCDKQGNPHLLKILGHESTNYPAALGEYLEYLWENYDELGEERAQKELNILVEWLNQIERSSPNSEFWKVYK